MYAVETASEPGPPLAPQDVVTSILRVVVTKLDASAAFLYYWDDQVSEFLPAEIEARTEPTPAIRRLTRLLVCEVAQAGWPIEVEDLAADPHWAEFRGVARTAIVRPLQLNGTTVGALGIVDPVQRFAKDQWNYLELACAGLAAGAANERRLREATRQNIELTRTKDQLEVALQELERRQVIIEALGFEFKKTKDFLEHLIASAGDAILVLDKTGTITGWNRAAERMYGYSRDEVLGKHVRLVHPPALAGEYARVTEPVLRGEAFSDVETVRRRKDGHLLTVSLTVSPIVDENGHVVGMFGISRDITERKQLEGQLRQAQKMEAVGRLAGGVAHDFNNILTAITGYSGLLLEELASGDPRRHDVEEIRKAAERAAALTHQLLAFSRQQVLQPRVLDLNAVVTNVDKMLQRLIREDVELATALEPALGAVRADQTQIEQVIMNLAVNARDAMPSGGRLTIETANVEFDEAYAREHVPAKAGRYVMLALSDTGTGMDAETKAHLFEPFFTTKEKGKGTGLGLATVYGIVKQSGGFIWVYSEPGQGTTFKIYLPQLDEPIEDVETALPGLRAARATETVLLAEDDPTVRAVARLVLERSGYTVLEAASGDAALDLAARQAGPIDLLLTDVVMPGMSGRELARQLSTRRPELQVLYMSGYTDDAIVRHGVLEPGIAYIQKPFTPDALAQKVRQVLNASRL